MEDWCFQSFSCQVTEAPVRRYTGSGIYRTTLKVQIRPHSEFAPARRRELHCEGVLADEVADWGLEPGDLLKVKGREQQACIRQVNPYWFPVIVPSEVERLGKHRCSSRRNRATAFHRRRRPRRLAKRTPAASASGNNRVTKESPR